MMLFLFYPICCATISPILLTANYLYFRLETLREYEREDQRYEDSKKIVLNL